MVEAANKILKFQFLQQLHVDSMESLVKMLPAILEACNNRPAHSLYSLTPNEVLNGEILVKSRYDSMIKGARLKRIAGNQKTTCPAIDVCNDTG